ncbi:prepilin-type N-terminal cleavage/methylation domain-containing protein [Vibrio sp. D173a]|uniref:prepilin-type N-terminal cleavage/methylation domain-containing protein n=1 Tax=Vibrio sp. D173a TaxID=2836349 RepID=UPI002553AC7C|nr:prepilin-type N-terminal cleavage/methylation domain-containing protein [Vibrio sp. D173a]MDK9759104.1 prepilin-type N-terminal cleavage/methylation domain-containing protein [Vibrio sp. D173a]
MNLNKGRVKNSKKKNQGIALIEMLIVIGIIGLITAGIVGLSTSVFNGMDESNIVSKINTMKGKIQKGYKSQGDYADLDGDSPVLEAEDIATPFGPDLFADSATANTRANAGAVIKIPGLTEESCNNILSSLDPTAFEYIATEVGGAGGVAPVAVTGDIAIFNSINDTVAEFVAGGVEGNGTVGTQFTVGNIGDACTASAANNNAILVVGFY